ncbi:MULTISPECIES: hypothetical protein [unclassified Streptomyces]|uniref:hypothetical protein n=1 Tax=unclassified Streptomyces TaxID=2593676 RepID=UPI00336A8781
MVTAWSPSVMSRFRPSGRPLRLLWVAALLFGLVYAHGVSPEGVTRHLASIAAGPGVSVGQGDAVMTAFAAAEKTSDGGLAMRDHHDGHHGSPHPAHECLVAQPQHGSGVAAPCPASLGRESALLIAPLEATGRAPTSWARCPFQDSAVRAVLRI